MKPLKRFFWTLAITALFVAGCGKTSGNGTDTGTQADETKNLFLAVENGDDGQTVDYYGAMDSLALKDGGQGLPRLRKLRRKLEANKFGRFAKRIADENKGVLSVVGFGLRNPLEGEGEPEEDTILHSCKVDLTVVSNHALAIEKEPEELVALGASKVSEDKHTITIGRAAVKRTRMVFSIRKMEKVEGAVTAKLSGLIDCGEGLTQEVSYELAPKIAADAEPKFRFIQQYGDALLRGIGANFKPLPEDDGGLYGDEDKKGSSL